MTNYLEAYVRSIEGVVKSAKTYYFKKMLKDTDDYNLISKYTGLTLKEIENLK